MKIASYSDGGPQHESIKIRHFVRTGRKIVTKIFDELTSGRLRHIAIWILVIFLLATGGFPFYIANQTHLNGCLGLKYVSKEIDKQLSFRMQPNYTECRLPLKYNYRRIKLFSLADYILSGREKRHLK